MSFIQFDLTSWLPSSLKRDLTDAVISYIADLAKRVINDEAGNAVKMLRSDSDFQKAVDAGLTEATNRFASEYINQDEDLVLAILNEKDFWKSESIRGAILELIRHPGIDLENERATVEQKFKDVLGNRRNRDRVNRAVNYYLRMVAESLWQLPQIRPIYEMTMQRVSIEKQVEMITQVKGLRADMQQVFLELVEAINKDSNLLPQNTLNAQGSLLPQPIYSNLPNPDYGKFVGREKELSKIIDILKPNPKSTHSVVVIDGIGGIGKSALALQTAYYYLHNYSSLPLDERFDAIIWTSAKSTILTTEGVVQRSQSNRTLEDIFATISITLKREDITRASFEEQGELVKSILKTEKRSLLIIDNLETIEDDRVIAFLRDLPYPTKAIVTTRHRIVDVAYPVRLTGMPKEDGLDLIKHLSNDKNVILNNGEMERLYSLTGGVPLAITWVVAQMAYRENKEVIFHRLQMQSSDISHFCFAETAKLIEGKEAFIFLKALSIVSRDASSEMLAFLAGFESGDYIVDDSLTLLEKLSLVNIKESRYSLLPLTKYYAQAKLEEDKTLRKDIYNRAFLFYNNKLSERERSDFYYHPWFDIEKDNILYLLDLFHSNKCDNYVAEIMSNFDVYLWVRGFWNESLKHLRVELSYAESQGNYKLQAHANRALGRIYLYRGRYDQAQLYLEDAYRLYKQENNFRQLVSSAIYLSIIFASQKNISRAEQILKENQENATLSKEDETIIRLQNALAEIELEQDKVTEAQERIAKVLDMDRKKDITASTLGIGTSFMIAGKLALIKREFDKAHYYFDRSLSIAKNRGIEQDIAYNLRWLADLAHAEARVNEAKEYAEKALTIFKQIGDIRGVEEINSLVKKFDESWKVPIMRKFTTVDKYE